jgi:uncharacterized membrane protein YfcA
LDIGILALFGLFAGIAAGFFGIGGGILFTPAFFILFQEAGVQDPIPWAIGSSLFCTFTASLSSTWQQFRSNNLYLREGALVGIFGMGGVWMGKQITLSPLYSEDIFIPFFAILMAVVAVLFYMKPESESTPSVIEGVQSAKRLSSKDAKMGLTGSLGGFLAALAGIGGGVAMVPLMNLAQGVHLTRAVSISSSAIVLISFSGALQFAFATPMPEDQEILQWSLGYIDGATILPVSVLTWIGGGIGVRLGKRASVRVTSLGFALLTVIVAVTMISRLL